MVFGLSRKEHRVPDLSRYDYYYRNKEDGDRNAQLSAAAAYAASTHTGAYANSRRANQPVRAHSMNYHPGHGAPQAKRAPSRAPSVGVQSGGSTLNPNYKTYSLRSQTSGRPPQGKATSFNSSSKHSRPAVARAGTSSSRANSITIKTTEVKDPQGRTQSITKRTVRRVNGYEYVETTTTTTQAVPMVDSNKHFDEFSGNYILQDNGLDELSEEDDQQNLAPGNTHAYAALAEPKNVAMEGFLSDGEVPLEQTSSISDFSDALDYVPGQRNARREKRKKSKAAKGKSSVNHKHAQSTPKPLTEQEMYDRALAIAHQKVYKNHNGTQVQTSRKSTMGQRNLRTAVPVSAERDLTVDAAPVPDAAPVSSFSTSDKPKKTSKKLSGFFSKNSAKADALEEATTAIPPVDSRAAQNKFFHQKKRFSDDEMYAKALAIAQNKYNQTHPASVATNSASEVSKKVDTNGLADEPHLNQKPGEDEIDKQMEEPVSPIAPEPAPEIAHGQPTLDTEEDAPGARSAIVESSEIVVQSEEPLEEHEVKSIANELDGSASDFMTNEQEAQLLKAQQGGLTRKKTGETLPVNEALPKHQQSSEAGSQERKSKLKNVFDKMKQFSAENSGYQPSKKSSSLSKHSTHTTMASATKISTGRSSSQKVNQPAAESQPEEQVANPVTNIGPQENQFAETPSHKPKIKKNFIKRLFGRS